MVNCPPQVMQFTVDLQENFIEVPAARPCPRNQKVSDFRSEQRTKPAPSIPLRFVADLDAALVQQVICVALRQRVSNIHHDRQANDFGRREVSERGAFVNMRGQTNALPRSRDFPLTEPSRPDWGQQARADAYRDGHNGWADHLHRSQPQIRQHFRHAGAGDLANSAAGVLTRSHALWPGTCCTTKASRMMQRRLGLKFLFRVMDAGSSGGRTARNRITVTVAG